MRTACILVLLLATAVPAPAQQPAGRPSSVTDLEQQADDLEKQISELSKKQYDAPATPTGPEEGFMGVEILGERSAGVATPGRGGYYGKEYDKLNNTYQQAFQQSLDASGKRQKCESEVRIAADNVKTLKKNIADRTGDLERVRANIAEERKRPQPNQASIAEWTAAQARYQKALDEAQAQLPGQESRLAAAEAQLPGLRTQDESAQNAYNAARGPLVQKEAELYKGWMKEPAR